MLGTNILPESGASDAGKIEDFYGAAAEGKAGILPAEGIPAPAPDPILSRTCFLSPGTKISHRHVQGF
jgi:hypothetical protein